MDTRTAFAALLAALPVSVDVAGPLEEEERTVLRSAVTHLVENELGAGVVPNKSQRNEHWFFDSVIQATAWAELSVPRALEIVEVHLRSQLQDDRGDEFGLIPARVNFAGEVPPVPETKAEQDFTQLAPLGWMLRAVQDRGGSTQVDERQLRTLFDAGAAWQDWYVRRRDRDEDLRLELNGSLEHPDVSSSRFAAFWSGFDVELPLDDRTTRPALNAVDLNAWQANLALELMRLGEVLGHPDAGRFRNRASVMAARIDDPTEGFWSGDRTAWHDYVREGENKDRKFGPLVRTPAIWSPLTAGTTRDLERVRSSIDKNVLDDRDFFLDRGVASAKDGPISIRDSYFTLIALHRYGFEEEAEQLRSRLLETLAAHPNLHAGYEATSGLPLGPGGDGVASAVALLTVLRRHEEEGFAVERGEIAKRRTGQLRRLFRITDGQLLFEASTDGTSALPRTTFEADHQIFSGEQMTVTFEDPAKALDGRVIRVSFPLISRASAFKIAAGSETREPIDLDRDDEAPVKLVEVRAGDRLEITIERFVGERTGCGCVASGSGLPALALLAFVFAFRGSRQKRS